MVDTANPTQYASPAAKYLATRVVYPVGPCTARRQHRQADGFERHCCTESSVPTMSKAADCPSCRQPMTVLSLQSKLGQPLELDLCFACHGIWVDGNESQQMTPQSVLTLFAQLHDHKDDPTQALKSRMRCPRCPSDLTRSTDRTRSGEYVVYRCANRHGRFGTFSSFMVEKGFVRHLNPAEVKALAHQIKAIQCSCCGASVDLRQNDTCSHCGAAFALLDPAAVSDALEHFAKQAGLRAEPAASAPPSLTRDGRFTPEVQKRVLDDYTEATIERNRERERKRESRDDRLSDSTLWDIGLELVYQVIKRW